jgi:hypothetical protein
LITHQDLELDLPDTPMRFCGLISSSSKGVEAWSSTPSDETGKLL